MTHGNKAAPHGKFMRRGALVLLLVAALALFNGCALRNSHNGTANQPWQQTTVQQSSAGQSTGANNAVQQIQNADQQVQNAMQSVDNTQNDANNVNALAGQENDIVP